MTSLGIYGMTSNESLPKRIRSIAKQLRDNPGTKEEEEKLMEEFINLRNTQKFMSKLKRRL